MKNETTEGEHIQLAIKDWIILKSFYSGIILGLLGSMVDVFLSRYVADPKLANFSLYSVVSRMLEAVMLQ